MAYSKTDQDLYLKELVEENSRLKEEIEKRKKSEEILEAFFKQTVPLVVIMDKDYNYIRVNEAYAKACFRKVSDFTGHNHFEFYPSHTKDIFDHVVRTKEIYQVLAGPFIFPGHHEWGVTYWDWTLVPVLDLSGEVYLLILTLSDVTEHVRDKDKLRVSKECFRSIFENSQDGILLTTPGNRILSANPAACRMFGRTKEEICAAGMNGIVDLGDPRVMRAINEREKTGSFNTEMILVHKDGTKFPGEITSNLFKDKDGRELSSMIVRDITARKKAEETLRLSEELFSKIFHANPLPMAILTTNDGTFMDVNEALLKTSGYFREELIGFSIHDTSLWVELADRDSFREPLMKKTIIKNHEAKVRKKSGEICTVLLSAVIITFTNQECVLGIANDITELRSYQMRTAHLERLHLVGEMAAGIGHEIRNPMTTVRGFLQLLKGKEKYAQEQGYLDLMIEELDRANAIITEYLSLARKQAEKRKLQNLNARIESLHPLLSAGAAKHDISINLELGEIPDLLIDKNEIHQLLLNLARNGIEAMSPGGLLTIRTYQDDGEVVLAVQDQGQGIASEFLDKVGLPFFTTKDGGTGLGLATCHSIAHRHNARIDIETNFSGTTFYVRFTV
ncbi:MAG: PAS domain S-box protein [Desulfotomaculaceae bacterium]|nr:PAS domain S-box protein [Desulfotomaculaceae bacterium]